MLNAIFRPLDKWPGEMRAAYERRSSPFKAPYTHTLDLLEFELSKLNAAAVVIQAQVERSQIRNDGWVRSDASVKGPAVILSFKTSDGEFVYPCDTFTDWRDNIRAIALSLEALRKIDRYGVTRRGEQYQGFKALPPPAAEVPKMKPEEAAAFLASKVEGVSAEALTVNQHLFQALLKMCRQQLHPDQGGSHEEFVRLQEAAAVLTEHFHSRAASA